jgi:hypothetical protein
MKWEPIQAEEPNAEPPWVDTCGGEGTAVDQGARVEAVVGGVKGHGCV